MPVKTIRRSKAAHSFEEYAHVVSPLPLEDGGGFLFSFPDLPGCIADGETMDEAIAHGRDAFQAWVSACLDQGRDVPAPRYRPGLEPRLPDTQVQALPQALHARLAARARTEGVSPDVLLRDILSEGLKRRPLSGAK